jgi:Domain of unknown function DUF11
MTLENPKSTPQAAQRMRGTASDVRVRPANVPCPAGSSPVGIKIQPTAAAEPPAVHFGPDGCARDLGTEFRLGEHTGPTCSFLSPRAIASDPPFAAPPQIITPVAENVARLEAFFTQIRTLNPNPNSIHAMSLMHFTSRTLSNRSHRCPAEVCSSSMVSGRQLRSRGWASLILGCLMQFFCLETAQAEWEGVNITISVGVNLMDDQSGNQFIIEGWSPVGQASALPELNELEAPPGTTLQCVYRERLAIFPSIIDEISVICYVVGTPTVPGVYPIAFNGNPNFAIITVTGVDATIAISPVTCSPSGEPQVNGQLTLTAATGVTRVGYSLGGSYTGPNYATATPVGPLPMTLANNLPNPSVNQPYTVRAFTTDSVYRDTVVVLKPTLCRSADLSVTVGPAASTISKGQDIAYTCTLVNAGPSIAPTVRLVITPPSNGTRLLASPSQGSYNATTRIWDVGTVPIGSQTLTLTFKDVTAKSP